MTNEQPTHLDLFSGIGGFALAARWAGFRTVGFCEIDPYCKQVLAKNFLADASSDGSFSSAQAGIHRGEESNGSRNVELERCRIFGDIHDLDGTKYRGVHLLTGGFPCQPFSCAGKRRGAADDRALWPQMHRVIAEARPLFVLAENVPGIINMELDTVLSDLESLGYACRTFVIPACAVDAKHRRNRVWIVGYAADLRGEIRHAQRREPDAERQTGDALPPGSDVADTDATGQRERRRPEPISAQLSSAQCAGQNGVAEWLAEPNVGRVANGIPKRVDRLKGLGNAIVPQVAYPIIAAIRGQIIDL